MSRSWARLDRVGSPAGRHTVAAGSDTEIDDGPSGGLVVDDGIEYYRIDGVEQMAPFLMTVVSDSDLWMFVSSTGALTAGRIDADHALFPYETDDRIHRAAGLAGPITLIARTVGGERQLWKPFAPVPTPGCTRSIAKSVLGNRLVFEEHNPAWGSTFRATWTPSDRYGWVRTVELRHDGAAESARGGAEYEVLDGFLDVMPAGVDAADRADQVEPRQRVQAIRDGPVGDAGDLLARVADLRPRRARRGAHRDRRVVVGPRIGRPPARRGSGRRHDRGTSDDTADARDGPARSSPAAGPRVGVVVATRVLDDRRRHRPRPRRCRRCRRGSPFDRRARPGQR